MRGDPEMLRLDDFLPYRLSFTSNLVSGQVATAYEAVFGLRIPEWRLIAVIAEARQATQQEIGRRTRMDKVTVSRAATSLVERGVLKRGEHPGDRRSHLLSLTPDGERLYDEIAPLAKDYERRLFTALSDEERQTLVALLAKIDSAALAMESG